MSIFCLEINSRNLELLVVVSKILLNHL
jgi:hypothetical protein